jgi:ribosome-associated heat shock protein Hsp15
MTEAALRIDKWLWFARFVKTRADAQKLIARGQVTLNGKPVAKSSASLRPRDTLSVIIGALRHDLEVRALGTRRGPAPEAQALYTRTAAPTRLAWEDSAPPLRQRL